MARLLRSHVWICPTLWSKSKKFAKGKRQKGRTPSTPVNVERRAQPTLERTRLRNTFSSRRKSGGPAKSDVAPRATSTADARAYPPRGAHRRAGRKVVGPAKSDVAPRATSTADARAYPPQDAHRRAGGKVVGPEKSDVAPRATSAADARAYPLRDAHLRAGGKVGVPGSSPGLVTMPPSQSSESLQVRCTNKAARWRATRVSASRA
jgi:hypothetical protein